MAEAGRLFEIRAYSVPGNPYAGSLSIPPTLRPDEPPSPLSARGMGNRSTLALPDEFANRINFCLDTVEVSNSLLGRTAFLFEEFLNFRKAVEGTPFVLLRPYRELLVEIAN